MSKNFWKLAAIGSIGYALGANASTRPRYSYNRNSIIGNLKARVNDKVNDLFGCKHTSYYVGGRPFSCEEDSDEEN